MNNWKAEVEAEGLENWLDRKNKIYWLKEILIEQVSNLGEKILQNKDGGQKCQN